MSKLQVPDVTKLAAVQKLCEISTPYLYPDNSLFVKAMGEIIRWHQEHNLFYAQLLSDRGFNTNEFEKKEDLPNIPFLPAELFKEHEILSIPRDQIFLHLTSSGTSGQKSQIFFDQWSIGSAQRMVECIFKEKQWISTQSKVNYLLFSYESQPNFKVGTSFTDHYLCQYAPANEVFCALRVNGNGGHDFDVFGCIERLQRWSTEGLPIRIFGFPAFLHFTLQKMKLLSCPNLKLHPESLVFLGGGWKGHAQQSITKNDLYHQIHHQLGIADERLCDGFGSVEHCIPYIECKLHRFHVPIWSRVIIRDPRTLKPMPYGQKGFLQFISPYITSVPAHSVLMGDSASLHAPESCSCGSSTPWFEIHGRAGTSKNKSCALAAIELLKGLA